MGFPKRLEKKFSYCEYNYCMVHVNMSGLFLISETMFGTELGAYFL